MTHFTLRESIEAENVVRAAAEIQRRLDSGALAADWLIEVNPTLASLERAVCEACIVEHEAGIEYNRHDGSYDVRCEREQRYFAANRARIETVRAMEQPR